MYGSAELLVTEAGLREIGSLVKEGVYPDPEGADLYTSGMVRTEQTFEVIYGKAGHRQEPLLREMGIGIYEMRPVVELLEDDRARAWLSGEPGVYPEGGESPEGFGMRVKEGICRIIGNACDTGTERVIAVVHGGTIVYTMNEFFPGRFSNIWSWTPAPGTGFAITLNDGKATGWRPIGDVRMREMPED